MSPTSLTLPAAASHRRPLRSATYHRLSAASRAMRQAEAALPTVVPTRSSLLRRALRSIGCAI